MATDLVAVNDIIAAASGVLLEVTRLLKREMELHSVAQTSHLGWKTVGELDKGELTIEEQDQARILPSTAIVAAERQYMSYHLDLAKTLSSPWMVKTMWSLTRPTLWRWLRRVS